MAEGSAAAGATGFSAVIAVQSTAVAAFKEHRALFFPIFAFTVPAGVAVAAGFLFQGHFHLTVQFFLVGRFFRIFREDNGVFLEDVDEYVIDEFFQQLIGPFESGTGNQQER